MMVKVAPLAGLKPLISLLVSVPPSVTVPVTMSWSYCVAAVVPPISTSREAPALSVKFPVASDSGLLPGATCPPELTVTLCTVPLPASVPPRSRWSQMP